MKTCRVEIRDDLNFYQSKDDMFEKGCAAIFALDPYIQTDSQSDSCCQNTVTVYLQECTVSSDLFELGIIFRLWFAAVVAFRTESYGTGGVS